MTPLDEVQSINLFLRAFQQYKGVSFSHRTIHHDRHRDIKAFHTVCATLCTVFMEHLYALVLFSLRFCNSGSTDTSQELCMTVSYINMSRLAPCTQHLPLQAARRPPTRRFQGANRRPFYAKWLNNPGRSWQIAHSWNTVSAAVELVCIGSPT